MKLKLMKEKGKKKKKKPKNWKILITIQEEFDHLGCFRDFNKIPKLIANLIVDNRIRD